MVNSSKIIAEINEKIMSQIIFGYASRSRRAGGVSPLLGKNRRLTPPARLGRAYFGRHTLIFCGLSLGGVICGNVRHEQKRRKK
jgi:hypothetical protein